MPHVRRLIQQYGLIAVARCVANTREGLKRQKELERAKARVEELQRSL